jgi:hypothetical protein
MKIEILVLVFIGMTSAFHGCKLSWWSNTRAAVSSEKYSRRTLGVARYLLSYWYRRADAGCCVLLRAPAQERPRKNEGPTPRCKKYCHNYIPPISKTAMRKPANEEGLLYFKHLEVEACWVGPLSLRHAWFSSSGCGWRKQAFRYGEKPRMCWISSRGQPKRGGPPAFGCDRG